MISSSLLTFLEHLQDGQTNLLATISVKK